MAPTPSKPKTTMFELHSNFTIDGEKETIDGVYPTNHQEHETLEITQGINDWSEVVSTSSRRSIQDGHGWQWVGDHIRPRVRVPDSWHWPLGVSLSTEVGYQRPVYSPDTWTWEIRPIFDKSVGRWYFAVNPAFERTLHGPDVNQGWRVCPRSQVSVRLHQGRERRALSTTATTERSATLRPLHNQQQQIFVVTDLNVSPKWEINIGAGIGPTAATDRWIIKGIRGTPLLVDQASGDRIRSPGRAYVRSRTGEVILRLFPIHTTPHPCQMSTLSVQRT